MARRGRSSSSSSSSFSGGDGSNKGSTDGMRVSNVQGSNVQGDTIRDLFYSFAHPGGDDAAAPYLDASDLGHLLGALGERVTPRRVAQLLRQVDEDRSGTISLDEFLAGHQHLLQHVADDGEDEAAAGGGGGGENVEETEPTDLERTFHG